MLTINIDKCTGCGACVQRCPQKCITWESGEFGFRYPKIYTAQCIQCNLCEKVCPVDMDRTAPTNQKVYAAVHKNPDVLIRSTSGGVFTAIADAVFVLGGVVYGVTMQRDMQVQHIRIESKDELGRLRGSKYVQSDTEYTFQQAESDLKNGRTVLYSGTPCQIDGLKRFLGKEYDNLYTVDIVCHGVGSQAYFDKYMDFARKRYGDIQELRFRSKEFTGWSCGGGVVVSTPVGDNTPKKIPYRDFDNYYYAYFLSGDIYRKSCYTCQYANTNRPGDFTLGDYWGVEALRLPLDTAGGCSLLIINTARAESLLRSIQSLQLVETTMEQATYCNGQLKAPSKRSSKRDCLVAEFEDKNGDQMQKLYFSQNTKNVVKGIVKAMVPYRLKLLVRSKRKRPKECECNNENR